MVAMLVALSLFPRGRLPGGRARLGAGQRPEASQATLASRQGPERSGGPTKSGLRLRPRPPHRRTRIGGRWLPPDNGEGRGRDRSEGNDTETSEGGSDVTHRVLERDPPEGWRYRSGMRAVATRRATDRADK